MLHVLSECAEPRGRLGKRRVRSRRGLRAEVSARRWGVITYQLSHVSCACIQVTLGTCHF